MLRNLQIILALCVFGTTFADPCPPAEILFPCYCDTQSTRIRCSGDDEVFDFKAIFDRVSQAVDTDHIFDQLFIAWTDNEEIPEGSIQTLKFHEINIEANANLKFIHPNAFNETLSVTTRLSVHSSRYLSEGVWDFVNQFKSLEELGVYHNDIREIPDNALGFHPNLTSFRIGGGVSLTYLGSQAFSKLPKIQKIDLRRCDLTIDEFAEDAFEGIAESAVVDLDHNPITRLPENIFKPLLDRASLIVGGEDCYFFCSKLELDCDEVSDWLCQDVPLYEPKLSGFYCRESGGSFDIFDYCRSQNSTL